jgi:hypothetical protein
MTDAHILWRRLDVAGHDACRLAPHDGGWRLEGTAAYLEEDQPACLSYRLDCDARWHTREGAVHGWIGERAIAWRIVRSADGTWTLNERPLEGLGGCVDLDLGLTPATNVSQLRRLALEVGQAADAPVAWLDVASGTLEVLHQRYERRAERTYWYEAPRFAYAALLEVHPSGFIEKYPTLWEAEARR